MAHSNNSIITGKFKGSLGKELVFREWEGKTVVAKSPKSRTGDPTPAQAELQEKFLVASRYAKAVTQNPDQSLAQAYAMVLSPDKMCIAGRWKISCLYRLLNGSIQSVTKVLSAIQS